MLTIQSDRQRASCKRTVSPLSLEETDDHSRPKKRRRFRKERVRFAPSESSQFHQFSLYSQEMKPNEVDLLKRRLWYSKPEFESFLSRRRDDIAALKGSDALQSQYCARGLEPYLSPSLNAEMYAHRTLHSQTILREFTRQRRSQSFSSERLAQKVSTISQWALQRAQKIAQQDEKDASRYQNEVEKQNLFPLTRCSQLANAKSRVGLAVPLIPCEDITSSMLPKRKFRASMLDSHAIKAYNGLLLADAMEH